MPGVYVQAWKSQCIFKFSYKVQWWIVSALGNSIFCPFTHPASQLDTYFMPDRASSRYWGKEVRKVELFSIQFETIKRFRYFRYCKLNAWSQTPAAPAAWLSALQKDEEHFCCCTIRFRSPETETHIVCSESSLNIILKINAVSIQPLAKCKDLLDSEVHQPKQTFNKSVIWPWYGDTKAAANIFLFFRKLEQRERHTTSAWESEGKDVLQSLLCNVSSKEKER